MGNLGDIAVNMKKHKEFQIEFKKAFFRALEASVLLVDVFVSILLYMLI